jgi:hypothetical protein
VRQNPDWLTLIGALAMVLGVAVIALLADAVPVLALAVALVPLCGGAWALGAASAIPQRRAERAAKTAQIERELEIG